MDLSDVALRERIFSQEFQWVCSCFNNHVCPRKTRLLEKWIALRDAARADTDAVLDMIRQALRLGGCLHGHDDDHPQTPPMLYPEWIACAVAQACAEQREALESAGVLFAEIAECSNTTVEHLKALARNGIANVAAAIRSQR